MKANRNTTTGKLSGQKARFEKARFELGIGETTVNDARGLTIRENHVTEITAIFRTHAVKLLDNHIRRK
jgi:hypothetical protein